MRSSTVVIAAALLVAGDTIALPTKRTSQGSITHLPIQRDTSAQHGKRNLGVSGGGVGYFATAYIGTPPQNLTLHVDTGSTMTTVLSDCPEDVCKMPKWVEFKADESATLRRSGIGKEILYGSAIDSGEIATDLVSLGGFTAEVPFLLINNSRLDGVGSPGLLGLGLQEGQGSWVNAAKDQWLAPEFSMWLGRSWDWYHLEEVEQLSYVDGAAMLTLGGHDPDLLDGDFHFTEADTTHWWSCGLEGARVDGKEIDIYSHVFNDSGAGFVNGKPSAAVDTGFTSMSGPSSVVEQIMKLVPGAVSQESMMLDRKFIMWWIPVARSDVRPGHSLEFKLAGEWFAPYFVDYGRCIDVNDIDAAQEEEELKGLDVNAEEFRKEFPDAKELCQVTIFGLESAGEDIPQFILGDPLMQAVYTKFRVEPPSIGFGHLSEKAGQKIDDNDAKYDKYIEEN